MRISSTSDRPAVAVPSAVVRWPFWAPTIDDAVGRALDLAGLEPGERLIDLGCGDGRILEAAAERGAVAVGYEVNPKMLARARERTARFGARVRVVEEDLFAGPLEADVVFCYLSMGVLYRLRDRLALLPEGSRVVTHESSITGWQHERRDGSCRLYRIPAPTVVHDWRPGFVRAGSMVVRPPGTAALISVVVGVESGALAVEISRGLRSLVRIYVGAPSVEVPTLLPVDIAFTAPAEGRVVIGGIRIQGHEYRLILVGRNGATSAHLLRAADMDKVWALATAATRGHGATDQLIEALE